MKIHQALFGYDRGHYTLAHSFPQPSWQRPDIVSRCESLSDLTGYKAIDARTDTWYTRGFPIGDFYTIARTWHDNDGPRRGCAFTHMLYIPIAEIGAVFCYSAFFDMFRKPTRPDWSPYYQQIEMNFGSLQVSCDLPLGQRALTDDEIAFWTRTPPPVICKNDEITEDVAIHKWRRLSPEARQQFTFCTSAFQEVWRDKVRRYDYVGVAAPAKSHLGNFYHARAAGILK